MPLLISALTLSGALHAETLTGKVIAVADGENITLLTPDREEVRVRIAGIDAPEKGQPFGQAARKVTTNLTLGRLVSVESRNTVKWGQIIGKVRVDGQDVGLTLVRHGYAWSYRSPVKEQGPADSDQYEAAESRARTVGIGLWTEPAPVSPWEWRKRAYSVSNGWHGLWRPFGGSGAACPCTSGGVTCNGPTGSSYCIAPSGAKHFQPRPG